LKCGACILRHDNSIAALGYNGAIPGFNMDWSDRDERRPFVSHAERSALRYCKPGEIKLVASTLSPCEACMIDIAMYGVKTVVYKDKYDKGGKAFEIAHRFNIKIIQING
jgi:dCMP deaminase